MLTRTQTGGVRAIGSVVAALLAGVLARPASAALLADSISVAGDSIVRAFDANTGSCNYGDNVSRNFVTGDDHGTAYCSAGGNGTFSHAERLECSKGGDVANFNDASSGATMVGDFFNQAVSIAGHLLSSSGPRYAPVFLGHNDACTNTTSKTGNGCIGDSDPNNYCRKTNAAFEREFRRGMDQLIEVPSIRIVVLSTVRISELCNYASKSACGFLALGGSCNNAWRAVEIVSSGGICASLTTDCSDQRRIDMYNTLVGYNEILERVSAEYAAIPAGGTSATGAVKAPDVGIRFLKSIFNVQFTSSDLSCCDCFHPSDQGQARLAEATWDGVQCSPATPCCAPSGNVLNDAKCAQLDTTTLYPGGFWSGNSCGNGIVDPGEDCDDGNTVDGDCCSSTCQFEPTGQACADDGNVCTNDACDGAGTCRHPPNTLPCSDGNPCTQGDMCRNGTCASGPAAICTAQDQCHDAGTCDPTTGLCSNPPKPDGASCNDGNFCTRTDTCQSGSCVGRNAVTCTAQDACHTVGTCNPATGTCSNPAAPNGIACDDGNACTRQDTCQAGICAGANPVVCTASDQCHAVGTCNPSTGVCSNPTQPDGTVCDDMDGCTRTDTCRAGTCTGGNAVVCTPLDGCHDAGSCDPGTGTCSNPTKPDGTACSDGNACTQTDTCTAGVCHGTNPVTCSATDACHVVGVCNPGSGVCTNPAAPDGTACDDGNACTRSDTCRSGTCTGGAAILCPPADQCHQDAVCDPGSGTCSSAPKPDGSACDDGDACTRGDRCIGGVCSGPLGTCGDGVVQAGCGEACDDGAGNGSDACCTADCRVVDGDEDGICDRDDPCTGGAPVDDARVILARLNTPPGDDRLKIRGALLLPAALDPMATGIRLLLTDATGRRVVDAAIPGGAYQYATQTGWKVNRAGTAWKYQNGIGGIAGIVRVMVKAGIGRILVNATGKAGAYGVARDAVPLTLDLTFDPGGDCGAATFPGPAPAPQCSFNGTGGTLTCR